MLETELKRMGRKELLDVLADQEEELESLRAHLADLEKKLSDRKIRLDRAGSIAEASLALNGVFEAAEAAAAQYVESIETLNSRQEAVCAKREQESKAEAETLLRDARQNADTILQEAHTEAEALLENAKRLEEETKRRCEQLKITAKREADEYWDRVSRQLEQFCQSREELRDLLAKRYQPGREIKDEMSF